MTKKERQAEIVRLSAQGMGRPTIVELVEGTTEWEVRKTLQDLRLGKLDFPEEEVENARERRNKTGPEIVSEIRPIHVVVPPNRKTRSTKHTYPTAVFVSDTHGQFVDERALSVACQIIEDVQPDILVHLGDLGDFYSVSSHSKNPVRRQSLQYDIEESAKVLGQLDQSVPSDTRKILVEGNHENRLQRYLWHTAPALADLPHLSIPNLLGSAELGWEYVTQDLELFDDFLIKHGDFVSTRSGYTARKEMDRAWMSGISGHCFDETTEILTPEGWVTHEHLTEETRVMTYNRSTDKLEWNYVDEIFRYDHFRELIHIREGNVDLAVTPKHGLWLGDPDKYASGAEERYVWGEYHAETAYGSRCRFLLGPDSSENLYPHRYQNVSESAWSRKPYDGVVWCVSVKNGTLVVRRNQKPVVTLNTHRMGVHTYTARRHSLKGSRGAMWIENGALCEMDAEYLKSPGDWQQGFTILRFTDDGPVPEMVYILDGRAYHNGKVYTG